MLNPINYAESVVSDFLRYQLTTYPFADASLHAQMRRLLSLEATRATPLLQGPYISLSPAFREGPKITGLVQEGVLHPTDLAGSAVRIAGMAAHKLVDDEPPSGEDVFIGTMHRAKGLEFKAVAVVGVDHDQVPLRVAVESLDDPGDRIDQGEQERQLLYVACSRARERLYISYTGQPSSFLPESASQR